MGIFSVAVLAIPPRTKKSTGRDQHTVPSHVTCFICFLEARKLFWCREWLQIYRAYVTKKGAHKKEKEGAAINSLELALAGELM